jgi:acyl-CoA synthetase (NDP forming)
VTGDGNPLDAWGNGNASQNMPPSLRALDDNADTDVIVFCSSDSIDGQPLGRVGRELDYARILAEAAQSSKKPHYLLTMRPGVLHTGQIDFLRGVGVSAVSGARQGLGALVKLADWSQPRPAPLAGTCEARIAPVDRRRVMNEYDAKLLLKRCGVPGPREVLCRTAGEVVAAALEIGFPVVLKVAAEAIPHKSEHGLVAVGLADGAALSAALTQMDRTVAQLAVPIEGWLVQQMVAGGVEMFAGVSRDPQFGLTLSVGFGGIAIEVVKDFALRPLPLREGGVRAMIESLRGAPLLQAHRGRPARDVDALIACVEALARLAVANEDVVAEIDINPLIVRDAGEGCVAVDALIVCQPGEPI